MVKSSTPFNKYGLSTFTISAVTRIIHILNVLFICTLIFAVSFSVFSITRHEKEQLIIRETLYEQNKIHVLGLLEVQNQALKIANANSDDSLLQTYQSAFERVDDQVFTLPRNSGVVPYEALQVLYATEDFLKTMPSEDHDFLGLIEFMKVSDGKSTSNAPAYSIYWVHPKGALYIQPSSGQTELADKNFIYHTIIDRDLPQSIEFWGKLDDANESQGTITLDHGNRNYGYLFCNGLNSESGVWLVNLDQLTSASMNYKVPSIPSKVMAVWYIWFPLLLFQVLLFVVWLWFKENMKSYMTTKLQRIFQYAKSGYPESNLGIDNFESLLGTVDKAYERFQMNEPISALYFRVRYFEGEYLIESLQGSQNPLIEIDNLKGTLFLDLFHESSRWRLEQLLLDSKEYNLSVHYEVQRFGDEPIYWDLRLEPMVIEGVAYWHGFAVDVTDNRLFINALKEEKLFIEELYQLSGALFCVVDQNGRIVRYNQVFSETLGLSREDLQVDDLWQRILSSNDLHTFYEKMQQSIKYGVSCKIENRVLNNQDERRLISWSLVSYHTQEEHLIILTGSDLTEQASLNQALMTINASLVHKNDEIERMMAKQGVLFETFERIREVQTPVDLFKILDKAVRVILNYRNLFLFVRNAKNHDGFQVFDAAHDFTEFERQVYFVQYKGVLGKVMLNKEAYYSGNVKSDPNYIEHHPAVHSLLLIPIMHQNYLWGIIGCDSERYKAFDTMDIELMKLCASHLGLYLEDLNSKKELQEEADNLKGLHHAVSVMMHERQRQTTANIVVKEELLSHLIVYEYENSTLRSLAQSEQTAQNLYGVEPMMAYIERAIQEKVFQNSFVKSQQLYHICQPIVHQDQTMGLLYSILNRPLTFQEGEVLAIMAKQLAVLWRLNTLMDTAEKEALIDPLTNIWNRRYILRRIEEEHQRIIRYPAPAALIMIDLTDFKQVNDRHGHLVGDEVLIEVAQRLKSCIRETDDIGRFGGDEFIVLLPNATREAANECILRMQCALDETPMTSYHLNIKADFGGVCVPEDIPTLLNGIRYADLKMYAFKEQSKRQHVTP